MTSSWVSKNEANKKSAWNNMQITASSTLKMEGICSSETSVILRRTTRRYFPEGKDYLTFEKDISKLQIRHRQYISNQLCACFDIIQTSKYRASSDANIESLSLSVYMYIYICVFVDWKLLNGEIHLKMSAAHLFCFWREQLCRVYVLCWVWSVEKHMMFVTFVRIVAILLTYISFHTKIRHSFHVVWYLWNEIWNGLLNNVTDKLIFDGMNFVTYNFLRRDVLQFWRSRFEGTGKLFK
jgi:hypothetical protein